MPRETAADGRHSEAEHAAADPFKQVRLRARLGDLRRARTTRQGAPLPGVARIHRADPQEDPARERQRAAAADDEPRQERRIDQRLGRGVGAVGLSTSGAVGLPVARAVGLSVAGAVGLPVARAARADPAVASHFVRRWGRGLGGGGRLEVLHLLDDAGVGLGAAARDVQAKRLDRLVALAELLVGVADVDEEDVGIAVKGVRLGPPGDGLIVEGLREVLLRRLVKALRRVLVLAGRRARARWIGGLGARSEQRGAHHGPKRRLELHGAKRIRFPRAGGNKTSVEAARSRTRAKERRANFITAGATRQTTMAREPRPAAELASTREAGSSRPVAMLEDRHQILVVDDEANLRRVLAAQLERDGYEVHTAQDGNQAIEFIREHHVDLVITDLRMPKVGGMDLLRWVQTEEPQVPVVMLTAHATVDTAVLALKHGAVDYISKPFDKDELRSAVRKALRTVELAHRDASHPGARGVPDGTRFGIIGGGKVIRDLYALLDKVADTPTTVLVTGETGTGKELVARALHEHSSRASKPLIKVNCAAIPATLVESELFGHEKGAFTGAVTSKPGRFELAHGGTLFLDEVAELPLEMQAKLLRVLQDAELERVGGVRTIQVDVRLVAATNRDLRRELAAGRFREDLFYRLNVVPIDMAPLRERADDIPLLASFFVDKFNARLGKAIAGIDEGARRRLERYRWPGNVRELEHVIERAVLFADGAVIREDDLPVEIAGSELDRGEASTPSMALDAPAGTMALDAPEGAVAFEVPAGEFGEGLKEQVRAASVRVERALIERALAQTQGNVTHAARLLKISRKGLQLKMKELELRDP